MRQNLHRIGYLLALAATLLLFTTLATVKGQEPAPAGQLLSPDQLDDLVAPIALYPDPLISQILVAVTYPLELVEANQWLQRNPGLSGVALTQAVGVQDWDPSVQALLAFSDVLNYLTEDISWTTTLGDAFLAQEADVMDAIQRMRAKAVRNGKLATSPQQQVTQVYDSGHPVYLIAPVDPEVIYVPVYDPFYIWGAPAYYPYASWYYPVHNSNIYFSRRVSLGLVYGSGWQDSGWAGWNDWGWRPAWGAHTVFVNNTFIAHHSFTSNRQVQTGTAQWRHDAVHRQGVPYSTPALTQRFHSNEQQQISRSGGSPVQQGGGMPVVQRANERTVVRQTSPIVRQDGGQARGGGGVSNGFRGVGQNSGNPNPGVAVPTRTAISTQGQQPLRSFETGRRGNVSPSPVAAAPAGPVVSTPVQQLSRSFETGWRGNVSPSPVAAAPAGPVVSTSVQQLSRSFETGRRGNVSPSPVAAAPAGPVVSTPVQQPSRSFETGRRGNVSQSPVAAAPAEGQSAPARVNVPQTNSRQTAPTQESSPVSRAQAPSSTQNYGGGGGGGGGRGRR